MNYWDEIIDASLAMLVMVLAFICLCILTSCTFQTVVLGTVTKVGVCNTDGSVLGVETQCRVELDNGTRHVTVGEVVMVGDKICEWSNGHGTVSIYPCPGENK